MKKLPDRFLSKVEITSRCWIWKAGLTQDGYGAFWWDGKTAHAHRYAWSYYHGDIPKGMVICHECDVTACVNPDHLFLGTVQDNHADMVKKRRIASGEKTGKSKLNKIQVMEMREKYKSGNYSYNMLSKEYGVTKENVSQIIKNKTWKSDKPCVISQIQ